jgi:DNA end-binding protein Ku
MTFDPQWNRCYLLNMKAMWKGTISFALISIPVKLYTATKKRDIPFHLLHKEDNSPVEYRRFCSSENKEVSWDDIVRGFEYQKKKYIVVAEEEFEKLPQKASKTISIEGFINEGEIQPIYFEKSYYLEPAEESLRQYALLREAMRRAGKVALARFTLREKEHMAVIRLREAALLLNTLFHADEIQDVQTLSLPAETGLNKSELDLAVELISRFSTSFKPQEYKDTYRESLMQLIQAKIEGKEVKIPPPPAPLKVISLMDALKKSLEKTAAREEAPALKEKPRPERKKRAKVPA